MRDCDNIRPTIVLVPKLESMNLSAMLAGPECKCLIIHTE